MKATRTTCTGGLLEHHVVYGTTLRYELAYTRDSAGRVHTKSETFGTGSACTTTYTYGGSPVGETYFLTNVSTSGATCIGSSTRPYTYDLNGNQTDFIGGNSTFDAQDRASTIWSAFYNVSYNANGDTSSIYDSYGDTLNYAYDPLGNLRQFYNSSDGLTESFTIDPNNRRVFRHVSTPGAIGSGYDNRGWLYSGDQIIAELDASGTSISHFAYATQSNVPDLVVRNESGSWKLYRILSDQVGTVVGVVCMSATCTGGFTTGQIVEGTAPGQSPPPASSPYVFADDFGYLLHQPQYQPFGFAGGLFDVLSSTFRFGARDYSFLTNRWLTKDPIRFRGGLNLYAYCNSDPVNCDDPSGLRPYADKYASATAAAAQALFDIAQLDPSRRNPTEWGGWVYQSPDGTFGYSPMEKGTPANIQLSEPSATCGGHGNVVGNYHSHRLGHDNGPSDIDAAMTWTWTFIFGDNFHAYISGPSGQFFIVSAAGPFAAPETYTVSIDGAFPPFEVGP